MIEIYGALGFIGYECLKIYKRINARKIIVPKNNRSSYFVSLIGIAIFSGIIAGQLANESIITAIFIGFSVPTNIKAIFEPSLTRSIDIDDTYLADRHFRYSFIDWYKDLFCY